MGCWNETCFLTGLPVFSGQPVMLIFVAARYAGWTPGTTGTGDYGADWQPATLPIKGYYDDYGGLEDPERDDPALEILRSARFRAVRGGQNGPEELDTSWLASGKWDQVLRELCSYAVRGELEMLVPARGQVSDQWAPCTVLMAHAWAWNHFVGAIEDVQDDLLSSVTFRLKTTGPLRMRLRDISNAGPLGASDPASAGIVRLAKLMAAMDAMRLSFHPTTGRGSQDAMEDPWQLDFQRKRFLHAIAIPHRYDELEQAPFSASVAWDGNNLTADRNEGPETAPDLPANTSPHCLWARILGAGLDNLLKAISEAEPAKDE